MDLIQILLCLDCSGVHRAMGIRIMMDFVLKVMDSVLKMVDFVLKMMDFARDARFENALSDSRCEAVVSCYTNQSHSSIENQTVFPLKNDDVFLWHRTPELLEVFGGVGNTVANTILELELGDTGAI